MIMGDECPAFVVGKEFGSESNYSPPRELPFESTGAYETDRQKYLQSRDLLYGENNKSMKEKLSKKVSSKEVLAERRKLRELDNFFDIVEEC